MPAQPGWYSRVPEIVESLSAGPPFLDRPSLEKLFGLGRRQAIRLMEVAGGYQVGRTYLVDRLTLVAYLAGLQSGGAVERVRQRKSRILASLAEVSRPELARSTYVPTGAGLAGVERRAPGRVEIAYSDATDLLAKLVEMATAAAEDFPRFREMFE